MKLLSSEVLLIHKKISNPFQRLHINKVFKYLMRLIDTEHNIQPFHVFLKKAHHDPCTEPL